MFISLSTDLLILKICWNFWIVIIFWEVIFILLKWIVHREHISQVRVFEEDENKNKFFTTSLLSTKNEIYLDHDL